MSLKIATKNLIKLNRLITNNRFKFFLVYLADLVGWRYTIVRFDPSMACNLRCQMCYFSDPKWRRENPPITFTNQEILLIANYFFPTALQLYIGCGTEPTIYKNFANIIKIAKNYKVPFVSLTSNGQLIKNKHLTQFIEYGLNEITLSTHGVRGVTYEKLMRGASYQYFIELLTAIDKIKREYNSNKPSLRINYTVNPDNLFELKEFFKIYGKFNIDTIQLRPAFNLGINTEYKNYNISNIISEYNKIVSEFIILCKEKNISLFYNLIDPTYGNVNISVPVYNEGLLRYISPQKVWLREYDWKNESYVEFKRRIGFRRKMLEYAVGKRKIDYQRSISGLSQAL